MIFESYPVSAHKGVSIEFDTQDIPIIRDVFSKYATDNQELLEKNVNFGFIFHAFLETTKDSHEPVAIGLKYEDSDFFLDVMASAISDYVNNDLLPYREVLVLPEFSWSVDLKDNEEAPDSPVPELDDKIVRAARLAMYFQELVEVNSRNKPITIVYET